MPRFDPPYTNPTGSALSAIEHGSLRVITMSSKKVNMSHYFIPQMVGRVARKVFNFVSDVVFVIIYMGRWAPIYHPICGTAGV